MGSYYGEPSLDSNDRSQAWSISSSPRAISSRICTSPLYDELFPRPGWVGDIEGVWSRGARAGYHLVGLSTGDHSLYSCVTGLSVHVHGRLEPVMISLWRRCLTYHGVARSSSRRATQVGGTRSSKATGQDRSD